MQLLLFLSAILTALTGVATGRVSPPQQLAAACAVEAGMSGVAARRRPTAPHLALIRIVLPEPPTLRTFALLPAVAIYATRRRE